MKIQKGHYVPKELITSEALHEAVVKCFVAAGFKDCRPMYGNFKRMELFAGLSVDNQGYISWGDKGSMAQNPLTIQQLFTAENGISWPDWAVDIRLSAVEEVCFTDGKSRALRFGEESTFKMMFGRWHWPIIAEKPNETKTQSLTHSEEGLTHSEWWDYENDCLISQPPVGETVLMPPKYDDKSHATVVGGYEYDVVFYSHRTGTYFGDRADRLNVKPLDHATRKAELERKRVVDAAAKVIIDEKHKNAIEALYDAGMLVMPK